MSSDGSFDNEDDNVDESEIDSAVESDEEPAEEPSEVRHFSSSTSVHSDVERGKAVRLQLG